MPVLEPLKPLFQGMLQARPGRENVPIAQVRAEQHKMINSTFGALAEPCPPLAHEEDHRIRVRGGEIVVRSYSTGQPKARRPCHLYFHGGGFWLGTLDQANITCRRTALDADCIVMSVDYRLAPEHKFPTAPEDCYAALLWVVANSAKLGVDPLRVSVGGGSAGGNLAAVVSIMARDRRGPPIVLQVLEIPVLDFTDISPLRIPEDSLVVPSSKEEYRGYYLRNLADAKDPYASPLLAPDLTRLPPALIMCAQYDPLRPEAEAYARKLAWAKVPVEYVMWPGQFHGSQGMSKLIPKEAADYRRELSLALRRAYGFA